MDCDIFDDYDVDVEISIFGFEVVFESFGEVQFREFDEDIRFYYIFECNKKNKEYWIVLFVLCVDCCQKLKLQGFEGRVVILVVLDVD